MSILRMDFLKHWVIFIDCLALVKDWKSEYNIHVSMDDAKLRKPNCWASMTMHDDEWNESYGGRLI